jgi:cytochrome P450
MTGARYDRDRSAAIRTRHAGRPVCQVRAASRPASWNEQMGLWLLTRYDDIRWALGDPRLSSTMPPPAADFANGSSDLLVDMYTFVTSSLVFTDPPDHTRLRRLVIAASFLV